VADHLVGGLRCADAEDLAAGFVLGALEPAEAEAVRAHLAACPEPHPEFAELGSVVPALLETVEPALPPAALKGRILAAAADTRQDAVETALAGTRPAAATARATDDQRGGWASLFRRPVRVGVAVAAVVAAVALGAWNLTLRSDIDGLTAYREAVAAVLDQAAQPGARLAVLSSAGAPGPTGLAVVSDTGATVSLVMRDLPPTGGREVYEAWLIAGENAPVPIGSFTVGADGAATFTATAPPSGDQAVLTVALTREPGPGATTPTLPIIAAGAARQPG
jgi:anti-sigma-K factor RskA